MLLSSRVYRTFRLLVVGALVISALSAGPALARGKFTLYRTGNEKCEVTPNPVSNDVSGLYTVAGSGFSAGVFFDIFVVGSNGTTILITAADTAGNFSSVDWAQYLGDGPTTVYVYQMGDRRMTVLASCSFQVS